MAINGLKLRKSELPGQIDLDVPILQISNPEYTTQLSVKLLAASPCDNTSDTLIHTNLHLNDCCKNLYEK